MKKNYLLRIMHYACIITIHFNKREILLAKYI